MLLDVYLSASQISSVPVMNDTHCLLLVTRRTAMSDLADCDAMFDGLAISVVEEHVAGTV
jgi:hypothetical protein